MAWTVSEKISGTDALKKLRPCGKRYRSFKMIQCANEDWKSSRRFAGKTLPRRQELSRRQPVDILTKKGFVEK